MYSNDDEDPSVEEVGSDELLAADDLLLPASASILVRLHALQAWLNRHYAEAKLGVGTAALDVQEALREADNAQRPRRRFDEQGNFLVQRAQRHLSRAQQVLSAYDEAQVLLENCVAHTTANARLLVEFYLSLEELVSAYDSSVDSAWLEVMSTISQHVEQLGATDEE